MTENDTFAFDPEGNAASALGFSAVGVHAGFRADPERLDMALVEADELCPVAGVFTTNVFCAAPVIVSREHLDGVGYGFRQRRCDVLGRILRRFLYIQSKFPQQICQILQRDLLAANGQAQLPSLFQCVLR